MEKFKNVGFIHARQGDTGAFLIVHRKERYLTEAEFAEFVQWIDGMSEDQQREFVHRLDPAADEVLESMGGIFIDSPTDDRSAMRTMMLIIGGCELMPERHSVVSDYVAYWKG